MNRNGSNGLSIFSILTIIFVVLKLTGNINWSWIWVLSPEWIGWIIWLGIYAWAKWS